MSIYVSAGAQTPQKLPQMDYENENKAVQPEIHFLLVKMKGDYLMFFRGCSSS